MPRSKAVRADSTPHVPLRALHRPRKRLGQHFLTDPNILGKIVRAAELRPDSIVLEIGPGLGHLTRALSQTGAQVVAVEVDRELVEHLRQEFASIPTVHILQGDCLSQAPAAWLAQAGAPASSYIVVANLPYYITSAILRHLLESTPPPERIVVTVQREVAQQIVARPPHMNLLAVSVQFFGTPRVVAVVPAGAFYPRPKVDSAIVRIDLTPHRFDISPHRFFAVVHAGFALKRKQLRNALAHRFALPSDTVAQLLQRAGIVPTRRAETLSLDEWVRVSHAFADAI